MTTANGNGAATNGKGWSADLIIGHLLGKGYVSIADIAKLTRYSEDEIRRHIPGIKSKGAGYAWFILCQPVGSEDEDVEALSIYNAAIASEEEHAQVRVEYKKLIVKRDKMIHHVEKVTHYLKVEHSPVAQIAEQAQQH